MREKGGGFVRGRQPHNHPPAAGAVTAAKIVTAVKEKALQDVFKPASAIVEEVSLLVKCVDNEFMYMYYLKTALSML